jgi:hypothetical protein
MVNDGLAASLAPPRFAALLADFAFVAFLLLIFVGLQPFAPPVEVSTFGGVVHSSAGDSVRQACYLLVFALTLFAAFRQRGLAIVQSVPLGLALLLAWCLASAAWAAEPDVAFRRAALEVVIVLSAMIGMESVGTERSFLYWRIVLGAALVVNWLSIPFIATAVHLPGELDVSLIGDWRGLYGHKNIAGAVCVLTILLFLFTHNGKRNWFGILMAVVAAGFLAMTHSKSSLGFLPIALVAGLVYRFAWRRSLDRAIVCVGAGLVLAAGIGFVLLDENAIAHILSDPAEFTGRAAIWSAELAYIRDHPLLGAGFGTFADTGGLSPLHNYVSGSWVEAVSHGHNGYLQLFVTIGGIGFALAMAGLIAAPLLHFWRLDGGPDAMRALLFAIFVFLVLHNFMESDFLEGDGVTWVAFLFMLAGLRAGRKTLTAAPP